MSTAKQLQLHDTGYEVAISILYYENPKATEEYDANWVRSDIEFSSPEFSGTIGASLLTYDFHRFYDELSTMLDSATGSARLCCDEEWIELRLTAKNAGGATVDTTIRSSSGLLRYSFEIDQMAVVKLKTDLAALNEDFPIK
jgi:hypothetical protein